MEPCDNFFSGRSVPGPGWQTDQARATPERKISGSRKARQLLVETHPGLAKANPRSMARGLRQAGLEGAKSGYVTGLVGRLRASLRDPSWKKTRNLRAWPLPRFRFPNGVSGRPSSGPEEGRESFCEEGPSLARKWGFFRRVDTKNRPALTFRPRLTPSPSACASSCKAGE